MEKTNRVGYYIDADELRSKFFFPNNDDKPEYFMEVTKWENHEGYTISINDSLGARTFELSEEELNLIEYLKMQFDYGKE